jgi:hypothetical protein
VFRVYVTAESAASPEQVLEAAGRDFSPRRSEVWSNVKQKQFALHESGDSFAEVTEGTWIAGVFWERCRYDWSEPGSVKATVLDSNVFEPGTTWELRASPRDGGSEVEMVMDRNFRRGVKGRIASTLNHLGGRRLFRWYLRTALAAIEKRSAAS